MPESEHARPLEPLRIKSAGQAGRHRRPARPGHRHVDLRSARGRGEPAGQRAGVARRRRGRQGDLVRPELAAGRRRDERHEEDRGGRGSAELPTDRRGSAVHRRPLRRQGRVRGRGVRAAVRSRRRRAARQPARTCIVYGGPPLAGMLGEDLVSGRAGRAAGRGAERTAGRR